MARPQDDTTTDDRMAPCSCCGLPRIARRARDTDDHRPMQCAPCTAHAGANLQLQSEHRQWWMDYRQGLLDRLATEQALVERMEATIEKQRIAFEDLRRGVIADIDSNEKHPLHVYLEAAAVIEANQKMDAAYRSRDRAFRTLWYLDERHHEKPDGRCACSKPAASCREFQILTPMRDMLQRWERDQMDRMRQGKDHGLPPEHPDGPRRGPWTVWKGARSLEDEIRSATRGRR